MRFGFCGWKNIGSMNMSKINQFFILKNKLKYFKYKVFEEFKNNLFLNK